MTTPHPMEIELKLAVPPQQAAAFVKRMARRRSVPVQQDLVTRYFDTPDFALSAQGVALRVRRVGRRWLQTLKTEGERQGGLSRRVEFEMPVGRGVPDWSRFPPEALAYIPEALRAQLAPVFETRFHRTAWLLAGKGGAQVEVALDVGEVVSGERRQPICEIELELKAGQPDALFALALDWAAAFDCLPFDVSKAERGVRLAYGIGAAPRLFRTACALPPGLPEGLRALAAALGPARDWDVLRGETLPAIAPHYPDADTWQRGMAALEARRSAVRAAMREALAQAHPGAWLLAMQRWLLRHGWHAHPEGQAVPAAQRFIQLLPLDTWVRRALQKGHRPIVRSARDFASLTPARRHALRIAIKRQRYAAEFFQTLIGGRRQAGYLAALRTAQD